MWSDKEELEMAYNLIDRIMDLAMLSSDPIGLEIVGLITEWAVCSDVV